MIKLKTNLSNKHGYSLLLEINNLTEKKVKIYCKALNRRPVYLTKYIECTKNRKDKNHRRKSLSAGIELIKKVKLEDMTNKFLEPNNCLSYEFQGILPSGAIMGVHIREENKKGNKTLYLTSTFGKY